MVRIQRSHRRGPGSIPGVGTSEVLKFCYYPGDLTVSKRTGTSNRIVANFSNISISSELISIPGRLGLLWTSTRDRVLRKYNLPLNNYHRYGLQFNVNNNYSQFFLFILLAGDVATNPGPRSSIECLYLNSRSLKAFVEMDDKPSKVCKIDVFQQLVYSGDYDVVCVCETWLNDSVLDSELLAGYSIFRRDRLGRTGGGVLVAVKDTIRTKRRYDLERNNVEFVVVELFQENMKSILLYTFYRVLQILRWIPYNN